MTPDPSNPTPKVGLTPSRRPPGPPGPPGAAASLLRARDQRLGFEASGAGGWRGPASHGGVPPIAGWFIMVEKRENPIEMDDEIVS